MTQEELRNMERSLVDSQARSASEMTESEQQNTGSQSVEEIRQQEALNLQGRSIEAMVAAERQNAENMPQDDMRAAEEVDGVNLRNLGGDTSIDRDLRVGRNLEVSGDAHIHHNLVVEGVVQASNISALQDYVTKEEMTEALERHTESADERINRILESIGNGGITGITKQMIEDVLTGTITSHFHPHKSLSINKGSSIILSGSGLVNINAATRIACASGSHLSAGTLTSAGDISLSVENGYAIPSQIAQDNWNRAAEIINELFEKVDVNGTPWIKAKLSLYTEGALSALGVGDAPSGGGSGMSYDRLDSWDAYSEGSGAVLSAYLGWGLKQRIDNLEASQYTHPPYSAITKTSTGGFLNAISVDALGHVTSVGQSALKASDIPDLSSLYLTNVKTLSLNGGSANELKGTGNININAATLLTSNATGLVGSSVDTAGKLYLSFDSGYSLPTTANQQGWENARIKLDDLFEKVTVNGVSWIKARYSLYTEGALSALGVGTAPSAGTGGGGVSYDRLDRWADYTQGSGAVLSADLGYGNYTRIGEAEGRIEDLALRLTCIDKGYIDSLGVNASTATALQTARTIWGQSFDGGGNVSGDLSSVGSITPIATLAYNIGTTSIEFNNAYIRGIYCRHIDGTTSGGMDGNLYINYGASNNSTAKTFILGGNVGIGTTSPAYKLDVNGSMGASGTLNVWPNSGSFVEGIRIHSATNGWTALVLCGAENTADTGTSANSWSMHTYQGQFFLNKNESNGHTGNEFCNVGGNWGIGTTSPAYKLDVNGSMRAKYFLATDTTLCTNLNADLLDGYHETNFFRSCRGGATVAFVDTTVYTAGNANYQNLESGTYQIQRSGYSDLLVNFKGTGSTSALQFYTNYDDGADLKFRKTIDSNRVSGAWATILTNKNYSSYALPLSGGTLTGSLSVSGNVGIGTTSPAYKLDVNGSMRASGTLNVWPNSGFFDEGIRIHAAPDGWTALVLCGAENTADTGTSANSWSMHTYQGNFFLNKNNSSIHTGNEFCNVGGNWGIGTTSPDAKLHVAGVIHATTGIYSDGYVSALGTASTSDRRLKTDIHGYSVGVEQVAALPSVAFRWAKDGKEDVGSIAQDLALALPLCVREDAKGYLGIDYGKAALLSVIATAKRTLSNEERIAKLEARIEELENELRQYNG